TYNWTDQGPTGGTRFAATYTSTLAHGAQTGTATLAQSFQITNPNASALSIVLFNYADIEANGPNPLDTDTATGGLGSITDSDGPWQVTHAANGASAFQASVYSDIRDFLLDSAVNNLNNSGLPFGPGDYTGAFQWNLTVPANGSLTVTSSLAIAPVPEPGTLLLTGFAAGLIAWRRRSMFR
ncbi:MAG TPA: PEP-CTERM sorting domain-containing protein, partial [Gemmataceae bacterium]|nr:PEP-CTERM sorting domain-containing protein [Gemmataceae bacterium]